MEYIYGDTDSTETKHTDLAFIKKIIGKPFTYWLAGSGDSAVQVKPDERLIFFKMKEGMLVMLHPDYVSPKIKSGSTSGEKVTHYVGGEPMEIPAACLCNDEVAFDIIEHYITTGGGLLSSFPWVDLFE